MGQSPYTQRIWDAGEELRHYQTTRDSLIKEEEFELLARANIPYTCTDERLIYS